MTNKTYDILKFITTILLPSLATFYFTISQIWNLPLGEEIVGTISAITVMLGAIINISSKNYHQLEEDLPDETSLGEW